MKRKRLSPGDLSDAQWGLLKEGVAEKMSQSDLYELSKDAGPCSRDAVREAVRFLQDEQKHKHAAKREGADLVAKFLEDARNGAAGLDEMAALLESALSRDILRRYAERNEVMAEISFENLLKLDLSYRKLRLAGAKREGADGYAAGFAVRVALDTLDLIEEINDAPLSPEIRQRIEQKSADRYGAATVDEAMAERNELERLRETIKKPRVDEGKELHGRVA